MILIEGKVVTATDNLVEKHLPQVIGQAFVWCVYPSFTDTTFTVGCSAHTILAF